MFVGRSTADLHAFAFHSEQSYLSGAVMSGLCQARFNRLRYGIWKGDKGQRQNRPLRDCVISRHFLAHLTLLLILKQRNFSRDHQRARTISDIQKRLRRCENSRDGPFITFKNC